MNNVVCLWCGAKLKNAKTKFCCSKHCQKMHYYLRKKEIINRSAIWAKKNPEKCRKINRIAVHKYLFEKRLRFNKLCYLNNYRRKVARLEQELLEEKRSV
jgi:hypothetical protein